MIAEKRKLFLSCLLFCFVLFSFLFFPSLCGASGSATASGGTSRDSLLTTLAADIDQRLPGTFDIEAVRYKYPVDYNESMNTGQQLGHHFLPGSSQIKLACMQVLFFNYNPVVALFVVHILL